MIQIIQSREGAPEAVGTRIEKLVEKVTHQGAEESAKLLEGEPDEAAAGVLLRFNPVITLHILEHMNPERREKVLAVAPVERRKQWSMNQTYPEDGIGRLMEFPHAVFSPEETVAQAIERLRELVKKAFITYGFVTDPAGTLRGVLVMRDLLLVEDRNRPLGDLMLRDPFYLDATTSVADAVRQVIHRHFPVYPVCDEKGKLIGEVRGYVLFEQQAVEISAQPGRMVGVEEEERISTPWIRSLKFRHPWLQLNLVTAFAAAAVVGAFQATIDKIVILTVFLPVLAGQSGNTGCQVLAVTLRGMTLGELKSGREKIVLLKEILLGLWNGFLVGLTAGLGMYVYARIRHHPQALLLAIVVLMAMTISCIVSGMAGVLIPVTLKRVGADPATASSIFLTTATDVCSMGCFLWLATHLIL